MDESVPLDSLYSAPIDQGLIDDQALVEASGLAYSRQMPGKLWAHNDSGDESRLFLLNEQGKVQGTLSLPGIEARDWEDMALGPGPQPGVNYLYIGEIGDNKAQYSTKTIYRLPEPDLAGEKASFQKKADKQQIESIRFRYPDGNRDAESLMIDPLARDLFVVSKREDSVRVYRAAFPQATNKVITLEKVGQLHFTKATAGDISADGQKILIKNYANLYYWQRKPGESVADALKRPPVRLPYTREPQGEAVAWQPDATAFFTLSEEREGVKPQLYRYVMNNDQ
ncbi:MAG: hypothetical protein HC880_07865 [Bacteroidia bacterium]|nr:hypothetical protein [Bacteroidia bacterium]